MSDSIVHWDRDTATGALTNQVNLIDGPNLDGTGGIGVSPDGKSVYVVSHGSNSLVHWDRSTVTGALSKQVNLIDGTHLNDGNDVVVSPDGKNVYVVAAESDSIVRWDRDNTSDISISLTSYDHWATNFNHVPNVEEMYSTNHGEGLSVQTSKTVSLAELLGWCHHHYPNYIGVLPNIKIDSAPDIYKQTCVKSVTTPVSSQQIYMKREGNWSTQYPLCLGCESGKSNNPLVVGQCTECLPGKYTSTMAEASQNQCQPCPLGMYTDQLGQRRCSSCPAGYGQNTDGQPSCNGCNPGHYQDQEGQAICKPCAAGTWSITQNSVEVCHSCLIGQRYVTAFTPCVPCPPPTYMDIAGNIATTCKECDLGKQHMGPDKVCQDCGAGKKGTTEKSCEDCGSGKYQAELGTSICEDCNGGQYQVSPGQSSCDPCAPGHYQGEYGQTKCTPAPRGYQTHNERSWGPSACDKNYFKDWEGVGDCTPCPSGWSTQSGIAQTKCSECVSGQVSNGNGNDCEKCAPGRYQPKNAQSKCTTCLGPKLTTWSEGSIACKDECSSGELVNNKADGHSPEGVADGACYACRYEGGRDGEHKCYCDHHKNCFAKSFEKLFS